MKWHGFLMKVSSMITDIELNKSNDLIILSRILKALVNSMNDSEVRKYGNLMTDFQMRLSYIVDKRFDKMLDLQVEVDSLKAINEVEKNER